MRADERVVALLYVLMRDHVPTGTIEKVTREFAGAGPYNYSASELGTLACRYADRLNVAPADQDECALWRVRDDGDGVFAAEYRPSLRESWDVIPRRFNDEAEALSQAKIAAATLVMAEAQEEEAARGA